MLYIHYLGFQICQQRFLRNKNRRLRFYLRTLEINRLKKERLEDEGKGVWRNNIQTNFSRTGNADRKHLELA